MNYHRIKITFILIVLTPVCVTGQGFPINKSYDLKEFELFKQNYSVVQDSNGFIFIGNGQGLVWFDGVKWDWRHVPNSTYVLSLFISSEGSLYYGGENDFGIIKYDSSNAIAPKSLKDEFNIADSLIGDIWNIFESKNKIFFQTRDGFIVWNNIKTEFLNPSFEPYASFQLGDSILVKKNNGEFFELEGSSFKKLNGLDSLNMKYPQVVLRDKNDWIIGSLNSGLYVYKDEKVSSLETEAGEFLDNVEVYRGSWIDSSNFVLGTLGSGIVSFTKKGELNFILKEKNEQDNTPISDNTILGLNIDQEGVLWLATGDGVSKILINVPFESYNAQHLLEGNINSINSKGNSFFIGTDRGLFSSKKSERGLTTFNKVINGNFRKVLSNQSHVLGSSLEGIYVIDENKIELISDEIVNDFFFYENEKVFFAKDEGIYIYDLKKNEYSKRILSSNNSVIKVLYDDKFAWGLTRENDVFRIKVAEDSVIYKEQISGLEGFKIWDANIIDNTLRIGTSNGLFKFEKDSNKFIKDLSFGNFTISEKQVFRFHKVNNDSIWFINDKKLKLVYREKNVWKTAFERFAPLLNKENIFDLFSLSTELFFGGDNGLHRLRKTDWNYQTDFKTNITDIYVKRDSLIYGGFGEPVKPIVLPYEDNEVRFNYAAASYIDETRNTYSYKLEGFDSDWSEWSLETQKDYTNIPEGEYIFKVRSRNVYEVDGKPDQVAFTVLPPWYRTWWAYMLYFISFSGLLYTGYKIRVNQLLKVERMRTKIASDLHDEVSATLTGISYFAEAIKRDKDESKSAHFISLITESAGDAKEKITDIVWSINPENDSWELFLSKCRRFASDLLESKELEYTLNITEQIPGKLSMEVRQHLWMIFKEMITNAVRHSKATRLDVIMDVENGLLKLIVQDNGIGFDLDEIQEGNGVQNIRKRAAKIGAIIKIHSEEDFGTRWRMELPL